MNCPANERAAEPGQAEPGCDEIVVAECIDHARIPLEARSDDRSSTRDRQYHLVILIAAISVCALSLSLHVDDGRDVVIPVLGLSLPPLCVYQQIWAVGCPGCGLTRSFIMVAHGQLTTAFQFNAVGPFFFVFVLSQVPYRTIQLVRIRRCQDPIQVKMAIWMLWIGLIALIAQWLIRLVEYSQGG